MENGKKEKPTKSAILRKQSKTIRYEICHTLNGPPGKFLDTSQRDVAAVANQVDGPKRNYAHGFRGRYTTARSSRNRIHRRDCASKAIFYYGAGNPENCLKLTTAATSVWSWVRTKKKKKSLRPRCVGPNIHVQWTPLMCSVAGHSWFSCKYYCTSCAL